MHESLFVSVVRDHPQVDHCLCHVHNWLRYRAVLQTKHIDWLLIIKPILLSPLELEAWSWTLFELFSFDWIDFSIVLLKNLTQTRKADGVRRQDKPAVGCWTRLLDSQKMRLGYISYIDYRQHQFWRSHKSQKVHFEIGTWTEILVVEWWTLNEARK